MPPPRISSAISERVPSEPTPIAARELLGDDAHRLLAEPQPAVFLRDREPEHAELGHLREHLEQDVAVGAMPRLRLRHDLAVGEFAHLVADRRQRFLKPAVAGGVVVCLHQLDQPRAALDVVGTGETFEHPGDARRRGRLARRARSAGHVSWLMGMPPWIWARYSPIPISTISSSISPSAPRAYIRSA